ncbi:MAG TPA: glycosyltransferase family 2 protein [Clostridia bacterium]|nr:glycosyltransferase family 2 protein [Clostridia bacterium]
MNKDKISIIVPVYNTAKYLKECVASILNQTYTEFELILVDDGSKDQSGTMCDELALTDSRIKVIHKENGGLSSARNAGLDVIVGEYVCFVDSDDVIHKQMLETLHNAIKTSDAGLAVGRFRTFKDEDDISDSAINPDIPLETVTSQRLIELAIVDTKITFSACNKMFRSALWENIRFREKTHFEDEDVTYRVFDMAGKCVLCDVEVYYYRMNASGITHTLSPKIIDQYYTRKGMYEFIRERYPALAPLCYAYWFDISVKIYFPYRFQLQIYNKNFDFLGRFNKRILRKADKNKLPENLNMFIRYYLISPSFSVFIFLIRLRTWILRKINLLRGKK